MTTEEVLQAWIDLPGKMEILLFNSMQAGFNETRRRFNVINKLLSRKDVGKVIIKKFSTFSPSNFNSKWDSNTKGKFITDFALVEFILSQPEVLESLEKGEKKLLFEKAKQDIEKKRMFPKEDFDFFWISSGLILCSRILEKENAQFKGAIQSQKEINEPMKRGEIMSKKEFDALYQKVNENSF